MRIINKCLSEFYPTHPSDTVVKNEFYPRGLTEKQIYQYYLSIKDKMLKWIDGRNVAFLIKVSNDQTVMIRNQRGHPIYLNSENFEDLITGRTNVVYVTHPELTTYWIVDIDVGPNLTMKHCQYALKILEHELEIDKIDNLGTSHYETLITSPKGVHLIGHLKHGSNIDLLRAGLKNELEKVILDVNQKSKIKFTVNVKGRLPNKINFDLSSMYQNSLHICKYSLTKEFLICDNIEKGIKKVS